MKSRNYATAFLAGILTVLSGALAADSLPPAAPTTLHDALQQGKVSINARLRYEYVDADAFARDAHAITFRTRLGYATAPYYGVRAFVEGENVVALVDDYYDGIPPNTTSRPAVVDPEVTAVNQAWIAYTYDSHTTAKLGRQRLVLDNARFVGDVGWRQDMQTFDAVSLASTMIDSLAFTYAYLWEINRVIGNSADWDSDSHIVNARYSGIPLGELTAYAYLLQFDSSAPNSTATFGAAFAGKEALNDSFDLIYRAEYAIQNDYRNNPANYTAHYHLLELGVALKRAVVSLGYERLGSNNGQGVRTPLGTTHAFNGWSDFASPLGNTFPNGLRDSYIRVNATLPASIQVIGLYHYYETDAGSSKVGTEIDLQVAYRLNKQISFLSKAARFEGTGAYADVSKYWLQAEYAF